MQQNTYNLKGWDIFSLPKLRTKTKERCVFIQGVKIWNNLNQSIQKLKKLKELLLKIKSMKGVAQFQTPTFKNKVQSCK